MNMTAIRLIYKIKLITEPRVRNEVITATSQKNVVDEKQVAILALDRVFETGHSDIDTPTSRCRRFVISESKTKKF